MAYFPFFIDIENKKGLIVGGGRIAAHKAEKVKPFGVKITIIAPDIMDKLKQDPAFMCEERPFVPEDIEGCAFVIAATDDRELNHRISALCQEKGILVNVVDDKDYCGFLFPSLVKEGKLTAGISTAGASPQIAAELRSRMARELPNQMEEILDYLESIREPAKKMIADDRIRARFLKETAQLCMDENRVPDEEETRQRIRDYCQSAEQTGLGKIVSTGMVTLVGAGCGAYDLITLRGLNAIRRAEVLVYDDLIDARLLDHASESCEKIYVGKRIGVHSREQEEINAILIEHAKKGERNPADRSAGNHICHCGSGGSRNPGNTPWKKPQFSCGDGTYERHCGQSAGRTKRTCGSGGHACISDGNAPAFKTGRTADGVWKISGNTGSSGAGKF